MLKNLILFSMLFLIGCTANEEIVIVSPTPNLTAAEASEFSASMLLEVNNLRQQGCDCGGTTMPPVPLLKWNQQLTAAADRHAFDMDSNTFFDHKGLDNSKVGDRVNDEGYSWTTVGENIAWIDGSIQDAVKGWKNSPAHCKQLMNADFLELGAAQRGTYWVQVFASSVGE